MSVEIKRPYRHRLKHRTEGSDDMADDTADKLGEARTRLRTLALGLVARFGIAETVNLLTGTGIALLEGEEGREKAATYLRRLADEIEADDSGEFPATQGRA
jgi:hypothetical protein